ncbi:MAG: HAMP domain-containing histidine kinase [candidate division WOR-3 bacterium]|nr:MAG: HAMP domain-containing histidine kinase [candidate division WOR-3 bacterium]
MRLRERFSSRALVVYFLIGIGLIGIGTFIYSNYLIQKIRQETETTSRIFAKYASGPVMDEAALMELIFQEVIQKIDFPVILTDSEGNPTFSKNVSSKDLGATAADLDRSHEPIPIIIHHAEDSTLVGYVHYGLSPFTRSLQILPFLETIFLIAFLFLGFWGYLIYRKSEEEKIWNSLARETAHQLATPLSSLVGWLEAFRAKLSKEVYEGINEDAQRMREVLEKFSRIGLPPRLIEKDPKPALLKSVAYMKKRVHKKVKFIEQYDPLPEIKFDDILLGWAIENILKNGLDAIGSNAGTITIKTYTANGAVIEISDTGKGIKQASDIFKPGFTTKKYGWGLGLVLTKRIIEDYHKGKLILKETGSKGTTFHILIPKVDT